MTVLEITARVDARGLSCPMPIVKTALAIKKVEPGALLEVLATDPGSVKDFETFSRQTGHALLSRAEANGEFTFFMRKK